MLTLFTFSFIALLNSLATPVVASEVLFELQNVVATTYYDVDWQTDGDVCAPRFGAGWAPSQIGTPGCEKNGILQADLGTNRIVAMNQTWMEGEKSAWCGKEVKIFSEDGIELVWDEPLVLWDTCAECATHVKIDLGTGPSLVLNDSVCSSQGNNPSGLKVQVMDNQIWAPAPDGNSYSPTSASTLYTGGVYNFPSSGTLSSPWGATISGDANMNPVVIATASGHGGAQATAAASGTTTGASGATSSAAAGTGSYLMGGSSATTGMSSEAQATSVAATATGSSAGTASAGEASSGVAGTFASVEATATAAASGSSTLNIGEEFVVGGSSAAEDTSAIADTSAVGASSAGQTQTSAASVVASTEMSSELATSVTAASTAAASAASATSTTCTGDDGETYSAGDHMCDGTTLKICANNESGTSNVAWTDQTQCPSSCSIDCGEITCN
ncbi:hypothetical protein IAR50_007565 [Cryptococcus sp. DSM 104548]